MTEVFSRCSNIETVTISDSVTTIKGECFSVCTNLTTVNYTGSQEQWNAMTKEESGNRALLNANIINNYGK